MRSVKIRRTGAAEWTAEDGIAWRSLYRLWEDLAVELGGGEYTLLALPPETEIAGAVGRLLEELAVSWAYLKAKGADLVFPSGRLRLLKELAGLAYAEMAQERVVEVTAIGADVPLAELTLSQGQAGVLLGLPFHVGSRAAIRPLSDPPPEQKPKTALRLVWKGEYRGRVGVQQCSPDGVGEVPETIVVCGNCGRGTSHNQGRCYDCGRPFARDRIMGAKGEAELALTRDQVLLKEESQ